jgi:hypothetical protein
MRPLFYTGFKIKKPPARGIRGSEKIGFSLRKFVRARKPMPMSQIPVWMFFVSFI